MPVTAVIWTLFIVLLSLGDGWLEERMIGTASVLTPTGWAVSFGLLGLAGLAGLALMAADFRRRQKVCRQLLLERDARDRRLELLEGLIDSLPDLVIMVDPRKRVTMANRLCETQTGYTFEEMRGREPDFLFTRPVSLPQDNSQGGQETCEIELRKKDRELVPTETIAAPVRDQHGELLGYLLDVRDISTRRAAAEDKERLESRLRQAEKMEAIGTLAGGIAHDFNNVLGIITVNTDMALEDIPEGNPARTNIERIVKAAGRAGELVKQILAYSRRAGQELIPLMPGPLIKESLHFLRSSIPATVTIEQHVNDGFRTIMMDPVQIRQMLVNLFANARHAIADKGTIVVTGKIVKINTDDSVLEEGMRPGDYFRLSVRDTGTGMDEASRERIFDPFFTTKDVDQGNGMGLALVRSIVKNHGASISVESEPGAGTVFYVYFPVIDQEEGRAVTEEVQPGTERILFVDDEKMLIEMASMFLRRYGYTVTEKTESRNALAAFAAAPDDFDIVVTDQTMPEMTGSELAVEMLKIRPDIPIILLSGYSKKISEEEVKELGIREFVYKPFDGKMMVRAIRRVLDG